MGDALPGSPCWCRQVAVGDCRREVGGAAPLGEGLEFEFVSGKSEAGGQLLPRIIGVLGEALAELMAVGLLLADLAFFAGCCPTVLSASERRGASVAAGYMPAEVGAGCFPAGLVV